MQEIHVKVADVLEAMSHANHLVVHLLTAPIQLVAAAVQSVQVTKSLFTSEVFPDTNLDLIFV